MSSRNAEGDSALSPPQQPEPFKVDSPPFNPEVSDLDSSPIHEIHGREISHTDPLLPSRPTPRARNNAEETLPAFPHDIEETSLIHTQTPAPRFNEEARQTQDPRGNSMDDERIPLHTVSPPSGSSTHLPYVGTLEPPEQLLDDPQTVVHASGDILVAQNKSKETSFYFPADSDPPNWRPMVLCMPFLFVLASISLGLAVIQEYILRRSRRRNGLMQFESLNDISVPVYFLWRYFPTMVIVSYGVAYQMVDIETKRLEPYYRLAQGKGATVAQSLNVDGTNFWTWFRPPFPGSSRTRLSTIISFLAVAVVPIIQNATLSVEPNPGGVLALHVQSGWSRSLTAICAFISVISAVLLYPLRHRTGLLSDPGGISGLLGMTTRSKILEDFRSLDVRSSDRHIARLLSRRRYVLYKSSLWQGEYLRNVNISSQSEKRPREHPFTLPLSQGLPSFLFTLALLALVPIFIFTAANIVLDKLPFLMTALGITVKLLWTLFDTNVRLTEPYYHLVRRNAKPNVLTVDYTGTVSFALPFKALKERHHTLALVSTNSIFLEILTVCLSSFSAKGTHFMHRKSTAPAANILEGDAETFRSFWISLVLSLLILLSLCATAIFVHVQRSDVSLPRKPGSLAFVLLVTHQSKALINFVDTERLSDRQREMHLKKLDKRYGFGWYMGRDGNMHCGIDEEPLYCNYKEGSQSDVSPK
ncbi:hypothetical protein N0V90_013198 [Kalmusia sp. IMI 367209]|nr:hypothetical protein N0V90_013198 [Kalmusia sp. IMI 367209]